MKVNLANIDRDIINKALGMLVSHDEKDATCLPIDNMIAIFNTLFELTYKIEDLSDDERYTFSSLQRLFIFNETIYREILKKNEGKEK